MHVPRHHEIARIAEFDQDERFERANGLLRSKLGELADNGFIFGAFPFGSTQFGDHNPYSDLDVAIAFEDHDVEAETATFAAIHRVAKDIYTQTSIPLEVSCFSTWQLEEGLHTLPRPMLAWLQEQRELYPHSVIGGDFVQYIKPRSDRLSRPGLADVDNYIARTRQVLKRDWLQGMYFRPHDLLSVVLSLPHVVGRKAVDAKHPGLLQDLSKDSIAQAVQSAFGQGELWRLYQEIGQDARLFQDEFTQQATGLETDEYDQIIVATLEDNLPKGIKLLRCLQEAYDPAKMGSYVESGLNLTDTAVHDLMVDRLRVDQLDSY